MWLTVDPRLTYAHRHTRLHNHPHITVYDEATQTFCVLLLLLFVRFHRPSLFSRDRLPEIVEIYKLTHTLTQPTQRQMFAD